MNETARPLAFIVENKKAVIIDVMETGTATEDVTAVTGTMIMEEAPHVEALPLAEVLPGVEGAANLKTMAHLDIKEVGEVFPLSKEVAKGVVERQSLIPIKEE